MTAITEMAHGLRFPEGPIAMPDGWVILVEENVCLDRWPIAPAHGVLFPIVDKNRTPQVTSPA